DPYSASKACAEIVVNSFRNSFFYPGNYPVHQKALASARAGNVIGGGDWSEDRIVPDIIRSLQKEKEIFVRNPAAVRPWQHVLEPITGYLLLGAKLAGEGGQDFATGWNFGPLPNQFYTVAELADALVKAWGCGAWRVYDTHQAPHEAGLL